MSLSSELLLMVFVRFSDLLGQAKHVPSEVQAEYHFEGVYSLVNKPSAVSLSIDVLSSAMNRIVWERARRLFRTTEVAHVPRSVHLVAHSLRWSSVSVTSTAMLWHCALRFGDALVSVSQRFALPYHTLQGPNQRFGSHNIEREQTDTEAGYDIL